MSKVANLIMVTNSNNNKFYNMCEKNNVIEVVYGRVGTPGKVINYPLYKWYELYNSKVRKGYTEITHLKKQDITQDIYVQDAQVRNLVNNLISKARTDLNNNYLVSFDNVSLSQITEAQQILDSILEYRVRKISVDELNRRLLKLYRTIPRKMKKVQDYLLQDFDTTRLKYIISTEQALLDNLKTQVQQCKTDKKDILSENNIEITPIDNTEKHMILDKLGDNKNQFVKAFRVNNKNTRQKFISGSDNQLFWHGSRTENWWSIICNGLKIRPTGVVTTGAMFGVGVYFADKAQKSIGYTSLSNSYWAKGNESVAYLALFEVNTGNQKHIYTHNRSCYDLCYSKLKRQGYDSVFAHAGQDLRNNEYIIYNEDQITIKYIVEIKR